MKQITNKTSASNLYMKKKRKDDFIRNFTVAFICISLGFAAGFLVMLISGSNPIDGYKAMIEGISGNPRKITEVITISTTTILCGLSVAFALKSGLFNIGSEGQILVGGFFSVIVAMMLNGVVPKSILVIVVCIVGIIGGALWGFIPGLLKAKYGVHEVVVTIMLNYIALYLVNYAATFVPGLTLRQTPDLPIQANLRINYFVETIPASRLHYGTIAMILAVVIYYIIMERTTFGYELKSVGLNKHASQNAGMKVNKNIILSMAIAGGFAGLAGTTIYLGLSTYYPITQAFEGFGFGGIAVALIGGGSALGSVLAGILLGALEASTSSITLAAVPEEIIEIIIGMMVIFAGFNKFFYNKIKYRQGKRSKENINLSVQTISDKDINNNIENNKDNNISIKKEQDNNDKGEK